jgi:hypothetical protein
MEWVKEGWTNDDVLFQKPGKTFSGDPGLAGLTLFVSTNLRLRARTNQAWRDLPKQPLTGRNPAFCLCVVAEDQKSRLLALDFPRICSPGAQLGEPVDGC